VRRTPVALSIRIALGLVVLVPVVFVLVLGVLGDVAERGLLEELGHLADDLAADPDPARARRFAADHDVRAAIHASDGALVLDAGGRDVARRNAIGAPSIGTFEPPPPRPSLDADRLRAVVENGQSDRCEVRREGAELSCSAMRFKGGRVVVVERAVVRGVGRLASMPAPLLTLAVVALLAGLLLSLWLSRRLVSPLRRLRGAVVGRPAGALLEVGGPAEVEDVVDAFNALLTDLEDAQRAKETLVADLAHALKSPLAAIRGSAELLEANTGARDALIQRIETASQTIDATLRELLELARAEAGAFDEERVRLDLAELVREGVAVFEDETGETLATELEAASIVGAPRALGRLLRALLENAAAHGEVRVTLSLVDEHAHLVVADDGPGFPDDVEEVFARFHSRRAGGTGIGLALVRAVAEAHGGEARATNADGARVSVRLPVA